MCIIVDLFKGNMFRPQSELFRSPKSQTEQHATCKVRISFFSYSTTKKMHLFLKSFILVKRSTCFGRFFRPTSGAENCTYGNMHMSNSCCYLPLAGTKWNYMEFHFVPSSSRQQQLFDICLLPYVQFSAPDDGRKDLRNRYSVLQE